LRIFGRKKGRRLSYIKQKLVEDFLPNISLDNDEKSQKEFKNKTSSDILKLLIDKSNSKLYPSRILNLAIYILISKAQDLKEKDESETSKMISDIFEKLNLSANKAEKDIGIYKSSISKMQQAKELIEELRTKDKKREQKQ